MKLLLLEDETVLQESIEEFLTAKGYSVDTFENSDDAFDAIFSKHYDLLLLDVNVPGEWDGFALRKNSRMKEKIFQLFLLHLCRVLMLCLEAMRRVAVIT
ncbi:MAG: response regulator [Sulfurimonas sp.]|nr:response regulator [Sulfurimonas sp.]